MIDADPLKLRLQILCGPEIAMGPGKADLLDAIAQAGSISGGARQMGMSYRRAWMLVDTLNRCWTKTVVETLPGGGHEKGARLTLFGQRLLTSYRTLEQSAAAAAEAGFTAQLAGCLRNTPRPPHH